MDRRYSDHEWRADEYTLLRGNLCLTVARFWCAPDERAISWHWRIFDAVKDGCPLLADCESFSSLTLDEAKAAGFAALDVLLAKAAA